MIVRSCSIESALISLSTLLDEFCYQARPSCLVAGADSRACVAMKIFVKGNVVAPMRIGLEFASLSENRAPAFLVTQKDLRQAARNVDGNVPESFLLPRTGRKFELAAVPKKMMEFLQRCEQKEVDREPNWSAPV